MTRYKMILTMVALLVASCVAALAGTVDTAILTKCKADLAKRRNLPAQVITVVDTREMTWPDAALGMPEIGKMYAQVITPGWKIILDAKGMQYLYTASKKSFRYGGPVALWSASMLYLQPVPDEPNLNGDLYQCSLLGTNSTLLLTEVSDYYPQAKGMVIATRRTSRSSFELLLVNASNPRKAKTLRRSFAFGAAALNEAQDTWAGFIRPTLGTTWNVIVARIGQEDAQTLPLPDGVQPGQIAWSGDKVMILVSKGEGTICYEISPKAATPEWKAVAAHLFPGLDDYMLNKSETLEISQTGTKDKPDVEVARVWFTGDRNVVAKITGLTLRGYDLLGMGFVFIWGEIDGKPAAFTVNISTDEVIPGLRGEGSDIKPFEYAPISKP
ncbi:MAG TPA: hypothetical protein VGM23_17420 [Armatimonadota bacterium]|jgi:hypothetical protein